MKWTEEAMSKSTTKQCWSSDIIHAPWQNKTQRQQLFCYVFHFTKANAYRKAKLNYMYLKYSEKKSNIIIYGPSVTRSRDRVPIQEGWGFHTIKDREPVKPFVMSTCCFNSHSISTDTTGRVFHSMDTYLSLPEEEWHHGKSEIHQKREAHTRPEN